MLLRVLQGLASLLCRSQGPDLPLLPSNCRATSWRSKSYFPGCFHFQEAQGLVAEVPASLQEEEGGGFSCCQPDALGGRL